MKMLIVEDDFTSRLALQNFLARYGECHVAVNGKEAVEAIGLALDSGQPYELVCMDILMPEMDGKEAVSRIRDLEETHGILSSHGAKIIMATAVDDCASVVKSFKELCDAYLFKPIDMRQLLETMQRLKLVG
ncbi:MAG: response regulator [Acidobacteriota bacterium]